MIVADFHRRRSDEREIAATGFRTRELSHPEEKQDAATEFGLIPIRCGGSDFGPYVLERRDVIEQISRDIGIIA